MKNLTLIIHRNAQQDISDQLRNIPQVTGFTFSPAEGHGAQAENDPFLSARDKVVGYTPRMRVDILLSDNDLAIVLDILRTERTGIEEQTLFWVSTVEQTGRF